MSERRLLQVCVAIAALVPVSAGLAGAWLGPAMLDAGTGIDMDSHFRYLSGLLLAIGLGFWSTVPAIEERTHRFRLLTSLVLLGGLARLAGVLAHGWPAPPMRAALAMELVVTPSLCLWQARIARRRPPR